MLIQDEMIKGLKESTRPIVLYRHPDGTIRNGFVMRADEFVTSLSALRDVCQAAGFQIVENQANHV